MKIHKDHKNGAKSAICIAKSVTARRCNQNSKLPAPWVQVDCKQMIAAHLGQSAPEDILVTFVIGAEDGQWHKNPIVMIIATNKTFGNVVHCSETGGLPTWKKFRLLRPASNHP